MQAAAHGVPTVATKNGGPVDIMATLHHGLLVDPTNSGEIADALLRILTNGDTWDEMSRSGAPLLPDAKLASPHGLWLRLGVARGRVP